MGHEMNIELNLIEKIYQIKLPNIELKSEILLNDDCVSMILQNERISWKTSGAWEMYKNYIISSGSDIDIDMCTYNIRVNEKENLLK